MAEEPVVTVTDASFGDVVLANERPVVVDFWAEWCKPCVMISKSLRELAEEYGDRVVIAKIDAALQRIDDGTYGYCEETGEPISLKRLDARPIATLSIEAQERHERRERVYRDD